MQAETQSQQWKAGDTLIHPELGKGKVETVFYWDTKLHSCITLSYLDGNKSSGTDQESHESNGWRKQSQESQT